MKTDLCARGKRVRVTNDSLFRGLKGTIQCVHIIDDEREDPFCFYLIALDALREPLWFEHSEVAFLDVLPVPVQACPDFEKRGVQNRLLTDRPGLEALSV